MQFLTSQCLSGKPNFNSVLFSYSLSCILVLFFNSAQSSWSCFSVPIFHSLFVGQASRWTISFSRRSSTHKIQYIETYVKNDYKTNIIRLRNRNRLKICKKRWKEVINLNELGRLIQSDGALNLKAPTFSSFFKNLGIEDKRMISKMTKINLLDNKLQPVKMSGFGCKPI